MESVLNKIFSGKNDDEIHNEFIKFSRGIFNDRYLIQAKRQKDFWNIKTGYEFANFFVRKCLNKIEGDIDLKGVVVYTGKLDDIKIPISRVKQFMGVKQYIIETRVKAPEVLDLMNKHPKAFYALSFKFDGGELKIKAKAPKSSKSSNKDDGEPKIDFCSLKTKDKEIINDLFFDFPDFKEIQIKHRLNIEEIILPKGVEDPIKLRALSKRKGKIIREIKIDGKSERKEVGFEA